MNTPRPFTCQLCGAEAQALPPGFYLVRVNPFAINGRWQCEPHCHEQPSALPEVKCYFCGLALPNGANQCLYCLRYQS